MKYDLLTQDRVINTVDMIIILSRRNKIDLKHPDRPNHGLSYSFTSTLDYHFDSGVTLRVGPNDMIYLPQGSNYYITHVERGVTGCVNFRLSDATAGGLSGEPFLLHITNTARAEQIYRDARRVWLRRPPGYIFSCRAAVYELLDLAHTEMMRPYMMSEQAARLQAAVDYINDHFTSENITSGKLASLVGVSEVYFRKLFRAKYGMSPLQYIKARRIDYAKELMLSSLCTVDAAGEMAGYADASYFIRDFKRATGMTPGEYRRRS